MVFGIPFVAVLVNTLLFGHLLQENAPSQFGVCIIIALVYTSVYWFSFRFIFKYIALKYKGTSQNKKRQIITAICVLIGYFCIQIILDIFLKSLLQKYTMVTEPNSVLKLITSMVFTVLIMAVYEGIYLSHQIRKSEEEKNLIIRENINSQLAGLKNQINPHFLFNSLNTLSSLVHEDAERADAFIGKLSKVYRYILDKNDEHLVTLKDELNYLNSYVYLMKERFGENLVYIEEIDNAHLNKYILPLSLQITFENCVKHNMISKEKPLFITVKATSPGDYLTISNNLQKIKFPNTKTAVGLDNIIKRYGFFTKKEVVIEEQQAIFKVALPLLQKEAFKKVALQ
jgi:two-component system, LytTR family, sensor kinase